MTKLFTKVQSAIAARRNDEEGAAMVEYGLLVAGIAVAVSVGVHRARRRGQGLFTASRSDVLTGMRERSPVGDRSRCPGLIFETDQRRCAMKKPTRDDRGAAMVEFAIVLPLLLMLLMGIIEFGRAYNTQISIQAAAREGARELALHKSSSDVDARVRAAAPSVTMTRSRTRRAPRRVTARRRSSSPRTSPSASPSCPASAPRPSRRRESCDAVSDAPPRRGPRRRARLGRPDAERSARHGRPRHRRRRPVRRATPAAERRRRRRPRCRHGLRQGQLRPRRRSCRRLRQQERQRRRRQRSNWSVASGPAYRPVRRRPPQPRARAPGCRSPRRPANRTTAPRSTSSSHRCSTRPTSAAPSTPRQSPRGGPSAGAITLPLAYGICELGRLGVTLDPLFIPTTPGIIYLPGTEPKDVRAPAVRRHRSRWIPLAGDNFGPDDCNVKITVGDPMSSDPGKSEPTACALVLRPGLEVVIPVYDVVPRQRHQCGLPHRRICRFQGDGFRPRPFRQTRPRELRMQEQYALPQRCLPSSRH